MIRTNSFEEEVLNARNDDDVKEDKLDTSAPAYIPESWMKSPRWHKSCGASASMDVSSVLSKNTLPMLPETVMPNKAILRAATDAVQLIESSFSLQQMQQIVNASQSFALPMNYALTFMNYNNLYYSSSAPTLSQSPTLLNVPQGAMVVCSFGNSDLDLR
eukprot:830839_1